MPSKWTIGHDLSNSYESYQSILSLPRSWVWLWVESKAPSSPRRSLYPVSLSGLSRGALDPKLPLDAHLTVHALCKVSDIGNLLYMTFTSWPQRLFETMEKQCLSIFSLFRPRLLDLKSKLKSQVELQHMHFPTCVQVEGTFYGVGSPEPRRHFRPETHDISRTIRTITDPLTFMLSKWTIGHDFFEILQHLSVNLVFAEIMGVIKGSLFSRKVSLSGLSRRVLRRKLWFDAHLAL